MNTTGCSLSPPTPKNCSASNSESGFDYDGNGARPQGEGGRVSVVWSARIGTTTTMLADLTVVYAANASACCAICGQTLGCNYYSFCTPAGGCAPNNCYLKTSNAGRMARADRISGPLTPPMTPTCSITLEPCPSLYAEPGYDTLDNAGTFYAYNILAELDQEGECEEEQRHLFSDVT